MGKTSIKFHKNSNGVAWLGKEGSQVTSVSIDKDKDLKISVSSDFSNSAEVTQFVLYNTDGNHGKGTTIGTWNRSAPATQPSADIDITISGQGVLVTDTNTGTADDDFYFSATCTDGGTPYSTDPELIVKKKRT